MSVAYINYHRQPRVSFTSINEYNRKFQSNVPVNATFEDNFKVAWTQARQETDPNDYIQHQFDTENMGLSDYIKKKASKGLIGKFIKKKLDKRSEKKKKKKEREAALDALLAKTKDEEAPKEESPKEEEQPVKEDLNKEKSNGEKKEDKPSLDDFLDDYEEENYEEETYEEVKKSSVHDTIKNFVMEQAKDSESFARDLSHVVHFNTNSTNISERLMKGRDRYMKRLQAYADGDMSVKVRMMNNKEVLVSELRPNIESLKAMLTSKSGAPRFCKCDC